MVFVCCKYSVLNLKIMSSLNPEIYYSEEKNYGSYKYINLLDLVNNFIDNQIGDDTLLGEIPRRKIIYQFKQGIKQFNYSNLHEIKGCELELNDTLTAIYPPDFVSYCTVSFVNQQTGELMSMTVNPKINTFPSWLQDNNANILFDNDGYILEGSSLNSNLESQQKIVGYQFDVNCCTDLNYYGYGRNNNFRIDVSKNKNGNFNLTDYGFHFGSDSLSKVIMLTYISDGLEGNNEEYIKINKLAESALYAYVKYNLLTNKQNIQEYIITRARKEYEALYRNASIKLMNIRYEDVMFSMNAKKNWLK
jgi:hypothetical protein